MDNPATERIILGIDPGTNILGFGVVEVKLKSIRIIDADVHRMTRLKDHTLKLKSIFEFVTELIEKHKPDELSVEAPFFGKNVQSMLKLGRAQGVAIAAALRCSIPVFEYSPKKIKQSLTGNGNASKEQVSAMIASMHGWKQNGRPLDCTDALAAAICHVNQRNGIKAKDRGWKGFIKSNPSRVSG
ncbi:crossover junction endodeoxyribonuclease RuvC [bacterium]|nr:crossover junction endodeoxyribonuclease RuvC [bacterium]